MAIKECNQLGRRDDRALADLACRNFAGRNQLVNPRARKVERVGGSVYAIRKSGKRGCQRVVRLRRNGVNFGLGHNCIHLLFDGDRCRMLG